METKTYDDIILIARNKIPPQWVHKYLKKIITSIKLLNRILSSCKSIDDLKLYGLSESDIQDLQWNYSQEHMKARGKRRNYNSWHNDTTTTYTPNTFINESYFSPDELMTTLYDSELTKWASHSLTSNEIK
jgi:hypothetical protein